LSGVVAHDYVTHHIFLNEAHGVSVIGPGVPLDAKKVYKVQNLYILPLIVYYTCILKCSEFVELGTQGAERE